MSKISYILFSNLKIEKFVYSCWKKDSVTFWVLSPYICFYISIIDVGKMRGQVDLSRGRNRNLQYIETKYDVGLQISLIRTFTLKLYKLILITHVRNKHNIKNYINKWRCIVSNLM